VTSTPPPALPGDYLDIYKLSVEMADRVSARRATANTFFLALNGALATVVAILNPGTGPRPGATGAPVDRLTVVLVSVVGALLALAWWALLRSYRDLNAAKFRIIQEMETKLSFAPFTGEWQVLKDSNSPIKRWRNRYAELGWVERVVPMVFGVVYLVGLIRAVLA
jgi:hypothetical protein